MTDITLKNFRCFGNEQTVPLAPLTFLVGENSTGKTSFMAMIRALWELAVDGREPNFNRPPYELGSFAEIAHKDPAANARSSFFRADCNRQSEIGGDDDAWQMNVEFREESSMPVLKKLKVSNETAWIECVARTGEIPNVLCGVSDNVWRLDLATMLLKSSGNSSRRVLPCFRNLGLYFLLASSGHEKFSEIFEASEGTDAP